MDDFGRILIGTEKTGFQYPIHSVELAAQKMRGQEGGALEKPGYPTD